MLASIAHTDDVHGVLAAADVLAEDGVFVIQVPYLVDLPEHVEYDTVYYDHPRTSPSARSRR